MDEERFQFENLDIYQRSLQFSIELYKTANDFPPKHYAVRDQLIRAVMSVPLNIAEGTGRKTVNDKNNFFRIARSSIFELIPLIEICFKLSLIGSEKYTQYRSNCIEFSKMLSGLINK